MSRTRIAIVLLAASLGAAPGCGDREITSKAIDRTIQSAIEKVQKVTGDTVNAIGNAAGDLGDFVADAVREVGKAIDKGRKESDAK